MSVLKQVNLKRMPVNRKLIAWCFVVTGVVSGFFWARGGGKMVDPTPEVKSLKISYIVGETDSSRETNRLVAALRKKLAQATGDWTVWVYRLDERKGYGINEDKIMPAASIMKVPIMLAVWEAVGRGDLDWDKSYTLREGDKQNGSGPIEFMDAGTQLTVLRLVAEMMNKSDNTAPVILTRLVGKDEVIRGIKRLSMEDTNFEENTTTAYDVSLAWRKIYDLADTQMQGWLKDSIYEERIPAGVPGDVEVLHKVGSDAGIWADSGIVMAPKPFILVIMNKDIDPDQAKTLVPEITKLIWDFETGRSAGK